MQTLIPNAEQFFQEKQPYAYWLTTIPGIGKKTLLHLLDHFTYPDEIYRASEQELTPLLNKTQLQNFLSRRETLSPKEAYKSFQQHDIRFLPCYHVAFPSKLRSIPDPPYAIYYRGTLPKRNEPLISIIGARNCSEYGRQSALYFANAFASSGIGIVSGLARGIDGYSQYAALKAGGKTYGILGSSVDICYPKENEALFRMIPSQGALISEYPPGTLPKANFFPMRNRIISGLSDALLVVEAKEKSGTLITVDMALEQGREVYAVPGRINDPLSYGCNKLIKQGAGIALSPSDIVKDLCMEALSMKGKEPDKKSTALFTPKEQCILTHLQYDPLTIDQLYEQLKANTLFADLSIPVLLHTMTKLTLKGCVGTRDGQYFLNPF